MEISFLVPKIKKLKFGNLKNKKKLNFLKKKNFKYNKYIKNKK